jgi:hypothetical protein
MAKDYKTIPFDKLEKIHFAQLKVIAERRRTGAFEGKQIKFKNPLQFEKDLGELLRGIFDKVDNQKEAEPETLLGMKYYIGILYSLPFDKLEAEEHKVQLEIKRRKEIKRQQLDAGNIEKLVKAGAKK